MLDPQRTGPEEQVRPTFEELAVRLPEAFLHMTAL